MLHHIELYVSDLRRSRLFWEPLLGDLGYRLSATWDDGFTLSKNEAAYLTFVEVADRHRHRPYHRSAVGLNHLAFRIETEAQFEEICSYCERRGIEILYKDRHPFPNGAGSDRAIFIEDPDRIKIEFTLVHTGRQ